MTINRAQAACAPSSLPVSETASEVPSLVKLRPVECPPRSLVEPMSTDPWRRRWVMLGLDGVVSDRKSERAEDISSERAEGGRPSSASDRDDPAPLAGSAGWDLPSFSMSSDVMAWENAFCKRGTGRG